MMPYIQEKLIPRRFTTINVLTARFKFDVTKFTRHAEKRIQLLCQRLSSSE